jgi:dienelactone hydrolase
MDETAFSAPSLEVPASRGAWEALKERTAVVLGEMLGTPPWTRPPALNPRLMHVVDAGGYWRKKVRYGNESDDVVWAWLLVPKRLEAPVPAVVCLPGSFITPNWGKDGPAGLGGTENWGDPEAYGADLARLGYVALCPDYPCAGERTTPGLKSHDTTQFDRRFPTWTRVGMSAWDVGRAVDFLLTQPEVDPERIGCVGWSQGGQMSLLGAALEPRIAAVASVCGWSPLRGLSADQVRNLVQPYNYPRLRPFVEEGRSLSFDLDHVAALIAPRPFLDVRARQDRFFGNTAVIEQATAAIGQVYGLLGQEARFRCLWYEGEHAYNAVAAREVQAWCYRWLWTAGAE